VLFAFTLGWCRHFIPFYFKIVFILVSAFAIYTTNRLEIAVSARHEQVVAANRVAAKRQQEDLDAKNFRRMTPSQHLDAAQRELVANAPADQIANAIQHLSALRGTSLEGRGNAVKAAYDVRRHQADLAAAVDVAREAELVRIELANSIEKKLLLQGYSVDVNAIGSKHTVLRFKWALVTKALSYQVANDPEFIDQIRTSGFKKMVLTDGYDEVWTITL
jgi:hypothetical protein